MQDPLELADPPVSVVIVKGRSFLRHEHTGLVEESKSRGLAIFERRHEDDGGDDSHPVMKHLKYNSQMNKYEVRFKLPPAFFPFLIGKGGSIRNQIQSQTNSTIIIPRPNAKDGHITIRAECEADVRSAYTRIELKVEDARKSLPYTHFVSLPFNIPEFKDAYTEFRTDVLEYCGSDMGIEPSIFVSEHRLHLTIVMLKLFTQAELLAARGLFKGLSQKIYDILGTRTLLVNVKGLDIMNDDPSAVHVCHARVNPQGDALKKITAIHDLVKEELRKADLLTLDQENQGFKPHITLMNSRFRDTPNQGNKNDGKVKIQRTPFDASRVISNFGERDFGTFKLQGIHLSTRGENGDDLYYRALAEVLFP